MEIPTDYKMEFHPRDFFQSNKNNLVDVWLRYVQALNQSWISDEDIGIFGSYLIGFDVKKILILLFMETKTYINTMPTRFYWRIYLPKETV